MAAPTALVALPTCTTRRRPSSAASLVEGSASKSANVSSSRMRTSCSSARLRTRWTVASAGEIETRTMLGEHALKLGDVGTVGGHRDGDAPGAIGAQKRMEIEIAGI